jgi:DNA-binding beta-propeller fold protein YncE
MVWLRRTLLPGVIIVMLVCAGCHGGDDAPVSPSTSPPAPVATAQTDLLGDLDGDGQPGVGDAIGILRILVGLDPPNPLADVDFVGGIQVNDAIMVLRCLVGLADWPIGGVTIDAAGGQAVFLNGVVTMDFPPNAVSAETTITCAPRVADVADTGIVRRTCHSFGPDGQAFNQPATVTVAYQESEIPAGYAENSLALYKLDGGAWQEVAGSTVDTAANTVTADLNSFSVYVILAQPAEQYIYDMQWGTEGVGNGEFKLLGGICLADGEVYVTDMPFIPNQRIQVFDTDGVYQRSYLNWSANSAGPGSIDVDAVGNMFLIVGFTVEKLNSIATVLNTIDENSFTPALASFAPYAVALSPAGELYITDATGHRVHKFNAAGVHENTWGTQGSGDGEFQFSWGVAVSPAGDYVYVSDSNNHRIQKYEADGTFLGWWGKDNAGQTGWHDPGAPTTVFSNNGDGPGEFTNPWGLDTDDDGSVYVADYINNRVQKFDANGTYITQFGEPGTGDGQFTQLIDLAVSADGDEVYIVDLENYRIQKFVRVP